MLLRYEVENRAGSRPLTQGLFEAMYALLRGVGVSVAARGELRRLADWFEKNLAAPERFNRSKSKAHYRRYGPGICWFKESAVEHVERARLLAKLIADCGRAVRLISTDRPGYVIFEDDHQVVAEPFREKKVSTVGRFEPLSTN